MRTKLLILIITTLTLTACQQGQAGSDSSVERLPPNPVVEPIDPATNPIGAVKARKQQMAEQINLPAMRAEVMAMIGEAKADDVQQCRVVGFGSKPCGGPASYIAISTKDGNENSIMALISQYNAAVKSENDRLGLMSDCAVVPKPSVVLENGVCTLKSSAETATF